jgi:cation diffusion facilitator family transporter
MIGAEENRVRDMTGRAQEIRTVLILTLVANVVVALGKLAIGVATGVLAMVADGVHSLLDGVSNVIGLVGNTLAARPADANHPYGHRRFETLASLVVGGMLLVTAWELVKDAIAHLSADSKPQVGPINFIAMIVTLVVNLGVTLYERREGKRLNSEFLTADAEHTRSDVMVSLSVLASMVLVSLGIRWADAVVTLVVVAIIGAAAWRILRKSASILVDAAALDPAEIGQVVSGVPGVKRVKQARSRGPGDEIHVDLDLEVAGPTTAAHSEAIAKEVRTRLREQFSGLTDIQVHFATARQSQVDYALTARAEADALGLGVHEVIATHNDHGLTLEMHIEAPRKQSISKAHALVTQFEERMHQAIPGLARIVTHIEPAHAPDDIGHDDGQARLLAHRAITMARNLYPANHWHDLDIRAESDGGFAISMHCHVPGEMSLEDAHRLAEQVETEVRAEFPAIHRVTIHTEPPEVASPTS